MTRKLSVSLPDDLFDELQIEGAENVSAFVASAIRQQLDRRRLLGFVAELEEELGAVDEDAFVEFDTLLGNVLAATARRPETARRSGRAGKEQPASRASKARTTR